MSNTCAGPFTCGVCICNPNLLSVSSAGAIVQPSSCLGLPGVGCASCGMPQVTVAAGKTNIWPWVIGIGAVLYLLSRHHRG